MKRDLLIFAFKETVILFVISYLEIKKENAEKIVVVTPEGPYLKNAKQPIKKVANKLSFLFFPF